VSKVQLAGVVMHERMFKSAAAWMCEQSAYSVRNKYQDYCVD